MKAAIAILLVLSLFFLAACGSQPPVTINRGVITIEDYMSSLSDEKTKQLDSQTNLLLHPLNDAISIYGDDYEFSWEGNYVKLTYKEAKCSFVAYAGAEFEHYDWYNNYINFEDCNIMEYLSFAVIERVIFDGVGVTLTDGISIGMSVSEISEKLNVDGIEYSESGATITTEKDSNGNKIDVYTISGQISNLDYIIVFKGDILTSVEIADYSRYLTVDESDSDNGKQIITEAFAFVSKNKLAAFNADDLSYKGKIYSSYYGSWFDAWQFTQGAYKDYEINVEQNSPNRVYIASTDSNLPILFWSNGNYVDPMLSFLGKWRDYNSNEYIDIKSISKEGIVVFDMYVESGINTGKMVLLKNLNTAFTDIPQDLDAYIRAQYEDDALMGDIQLFDGEVQSGYYIYNSQKFYMIDSLVMTFKGSVQYLPRSVTDRVGAGPLPIHIPKTSCDYTQTSTWGYMEDFGRDDPNADNIISTKKSAGGSVINKYLNEVYETSGLKYANIEYRYLYDYVFHINDVTYNVWESTNEENPHYLYVDSGNESIIKEYHFNLISKHSKELVYKANTIVSSKSYAEQKYVTLDGKITVDLVNRTITKTDSFVNNVEIPELYLDMVGENERFMFFANIGKRFTLNGYVLFDHTTWGATLHITDSNIPDFDIGVYYLNSETFFLDPTIKVMEIPEKGENEKYLDDKLDEAEPETTHIIREVSGRIIGYIYIDKQGKKTVKNYTGKILGYYHPDRNVTTDYTGKILNRGDASSALLFTQ